MVTVSDLKLSFGDRVLFKDVNLKFTPGNCYGIIGANGAGKSTFLKLLSRELEADSGQISYPSKARMAVLRQEHYQYEDLPILDVVIMGYPKLHRIRKEREDLYAKPDFSEADGLRAGELETEFAELGGWEAEAQAAILLSGLGMSESEPLLLNFDALPGGDVEKKLSHICHLIKKTMKNTQPVGLRIGGLLYHPEPSREHKRKLLKALAVYGSNETPLQS